MKWALFFCILSFDLYTQPIQQPEIIKTFVSKNGCVREREFLIDKAVKINMGLGKENSPVIYIACIQYTGPWKKEIAYGKEK